MTVWFISRHPGALEWAKSLDTHIDRHAIHLDPSVVQGGDTVIGTLPVHLAAQVCSKGALFFNLTLDLPPEWRGRELGAAELNACNARIERFHIVRTEHELSTVNTSRQQS
jgi:CRISPR-associated protein Csx16